MLRKSSSFDATFLQLDAININSFVEIDTKDGYEYHKICGYRLDKDGLLNAILSDVNDPSIFRRIPIANPDLDLVYEGLMSKEEDALN